MSIAQRLVDLFAAGTLEGRALFELLQAGAAEDAEQAAAMDSALAASFTGFLLTAALLRCGYTALRGSDTKLH